jgi:hypothetical protein
MQRMQQRVHMGELPNSHGRTLTDKSYVMHSILSGTGNALSPAYESGIVSPELPVFSFPLALTRESMSNACKILLLTP